MTRSRRTSGKATAKQNQKEIAQLQGVVNEVVNAISNDMGRVNGILYALLTDMGKLKEEACPHCGQKLFEPDLPLLPKSEVCPACGGKLREDQMKIDDFQNWDNNAKTESEEG